MLAVIFGRVVVPYGRVINGVPFIRLYIAIHLPTLSCFLHFILLPLLLRRNYVNGYICNTSVQNVYDRMLAIKKKPTRCEFLTLSFQIEIVKPDQVWLLAIATAHWECSSTLHQEDSSCSTYFMANTTVIASSQWSVFVCTRCMCVVWIIPRYTHSHPSGWMLLAKYQINLELREGSWIKTCSHVFQNRDHLEKHLK